MPSEQHAQVFAIVGTIFPADPMPPSVHNLIEFMVGRQLLREEAMDWQPACAEELSRQHSNLADPALADRGDDVAVWIDGLQQRFGHTLPIHSLS